MVQGPVLGTVTFAVGVVALSNRWRRGSVVARRAMFPPLVTGGAALFLIVVAVLVEQIDERATLVVDWAGGLAVLAFPISILVGIVRTQLAHVRASELAVVLHRDALDPTELEAALAGALGDPTLSIAYWSPRLGHHVDATGARVDDVAAEGRSHPVIDHDGTQIAVLGYDPTLDHSPGLIDAVAATAGLALENERLRAELRAQLTALQQSRARIIAARGRRTTASGAKPPRRCPTTAPRSRARPPARPLRARRHQPAHDRDAARRRSRGSGGDRGATRPGAGPAPCVADRERPASRRGCARRQGAVHGHRRLLSARRDRRAGESHRVLRGRRGTCQRRQARHAVEGRDRASAKATDTSL